MKLYISKSEAAEKNIVADDMILTTDMPTSAGSKMLDGYMSLFEAGVVTKLSEKGYKVFAKANTGEFGLDLLGETSYYGACVDADGNLTNAVAESIKSNDAMAGITLEVNGVSARAAALNNLTYLKPTYGVVSRFGTIPAVCSGEAVGVMAQTAGVCREIFSEIAAHDDRDGTSLSEEKCTLAKTDSKQIRKIAVPAAMLSDVDGQTLARINSFREKAQACGIEIVEIDGSELLLAQPAWNILMSAEVCNNVSKYDGVKYGYRTSDYKNIDELYTNSRTEAFGYLLKSTILFGSETLSTDNYMKVYDKALRIRRVLSEYLTKTFEDVDALLLPACSKSVFTQAEADENKYIAFDESKYTAPSCITGLPVVVTDGVQVMGSALSDGSLLGMAAMLQKEGE